MTSFPRMIIYIDKTRGIRGVLVLNLSLQLRKVVEGKDFVITLFGDLENSTVDNLNDLGI
jgi:hypothetical protein